MDLTGSPQNYTRSVLKWVLWKYTYMYIICIYIYSYHYLKFIDYTHWYQLSIIYLPAIKCGNGKTPILELLIGRIIYKWWILMDVLKLPCLKTGGGNKHSHENLKKNTKKSQFLMSTASPTFFQAIPVLAFRVSILWWHFLGSSHGDVTKISPSIYRIWFIHGRSPGWRLYIWYPLVNIQIAIEHDHRNSGFTHEK